MANTSPRHMPVLGNIHPIEIENFDIFAWLKKEKWRHKKYVNIWL